MSTPTDQIIKLFINKVDADISYGNKDLQKILSEAFKEVTKSVKNKDNVDGEEAKPRKQRTKRERDENGNIIKKRAPSVYNLFIKEQTAKINIDNPDLNSKVVFKMAIDAWRQLKVDGNGDDVIVVKEENDY